MAEEGKCMRQLLNLKDSSFAISPQLFWFPSIKDSVFFPYFFIIKSQSSHP
jgi:hypothetical protein